MGVFGLFYAYPMTYLEWNKILSEYFFNIDNAGRDVYLYLSKDDIVTIGKQFLPSKTEDEILRDYLHALSIDRSFLSLLSSSFFMYCPNNCTSDLWFSFVPL